VSGIILNTCCFLGDVILACEVLLFMVASLVVRSKSMSTIIPGSGRLGVSLGYLKMVVGRLGIEQFPFLAIFDFLSSLASRFGMGG
jgi:hypothetical protein